MDPTSGQLDDHSRSIIHIDLDCFYAQVEMIKNPSLRNVPLGIQQKNIVVTSNYIARNFGIKKCMLIAEAMKACPNLVLVKGEDLHDYRQTSSKVTTILKEFSPLVERLGLDENYIDVSDLVKEQVNKYSKVVSGHIFGDTTTTSCDCGCSDRLKIATNIAQEMRDKLNTELKLTSCAGIAHNKLLAKLVGAQHKPNQQTVVFPNSALELMLSLNQASDIPGIGTALGQKLAGYNIKTVEDLQNTDMPKLVTILGADKAKVFYYLSLGVDDAPVKTSGRAQSIGIEDSCKAMSALGDVRNKIKELLYRLLVLIQEDGRTPTTVKLTVRKLENGQKISTRVTKQANINPSLFTESSIKLLPANETTIMNTIITLFTKIVDVQKFHVTLLGLAFTKFLEQPDATQPNISWFFQKNIEGSTVKNSKETKISTSIIQPSTSQTSAVKRKFNAEATSKVSVEVDGIFCPSDVEEEVFRELPNEIQKEIWHDYKQRKRKMSHEQKQVKKLKQNSVTNYFFKT